ncbi:MAG: sulfatase-like hydrolase/transferase [Myxococcota bacterium]|nr:sulfatase-like hydrolase/transferase [Myxococcota bacterium]
MSSGTPGARGRTNSVWALGIWGGAIAGAMVGWAEALFLLSQAATGEYRALLFGAVSYGIVGGLLGIPVSALIGWRYRTMRVRGDALAWSWGFLCVGGGLVAALSVLYVDRLVYLEQGLTTYGALVLGSSWLLGGLMGRWLLPIFLTKTLLGFVLTSRGSLGAFGTLVLFSAVFSWVPGSPDPRGELAPYRDQKGMEAKPNILLVLVDALRADQLGSYGAARHGISPNLDALARDGLVFEQAFSPASWTRPSVATLLSGVAPSSHTCDAKGDVLPDGVVSLAEVLAEHGYVTGALPNNIHVSRSFNFQQGFDYFSFQAPEHLFGVTESASRLMLVHGLGRLWDRVFGASGSVTRYYQPAEVVLDEARAFIEANGEQRWFLWAHLMKPHDPYFAHPYDGTAYARSEDPDPDVGSLPERLATYQGEIQHLDEQLGVFLDHLRRQGLYEDMLIVVVSDHGEEFREHGGWWHGTTLYDEQVHVPMLVKLPGGKKAGARVARQVRLLDLAPTVVNQVEVPLPEVWQGADLLQDDGGDERVVLLENQLAGVFLNGVRAQGWKLIQQDTREQGGPATEELYDLGGDPREQRDLAGSRGESQTALTRLLVEGLMEATALRVEEEITESYEPDLERMRALGYME